MHPLLKHSILKRVNIVAGVCVHLVNSDEMGISTVIIRNKDGLLSTENKTEETRTLEDLKRIVPSSVPVFLCIDGWGVLLKKSVSNNGNQLGSVYNSAEFWTRELFAGDNKNGFISIIRQELISDVIAGMKGVGSGLLGVEVGPFAGIELLIALKAEGSFRMGNRIAVIKNGLVEDIRVASGSDPEEFCLGDECFSSFSFPAFAMGALFFAGDYQILERNPHSVTDYLYRKMTSYLSVSMLCCLLIGLLVNYVIFTSYQQKLVTINAQFRANQSLYKRLEAAEGELRQKETLIESSGLSGHTYFAYYGDRLALLMPEGLVLDVMNFQPLEKKLQAGREAMFTENRIIISGKSSESLLINEWIERIKKEKWVRSVDMVLYRQEEDVEDALFKLEVKF